MMLALCEETEAQTLMKAAQMDPTWLAGSRATVVLKFTRFQGYSNCNCCIAVSGFALDGTTQLCVWEAETLGS